MKKIFYAIIAVLFLVGCGKKNESGVLKEVENKLNKADSYNLVGNLEMVNNESSYKYDVEVSYLKDDKFKVSLNNQINNHTQVILKNDDGVYRLEPSQTKTNPLKEVIAARTEDDQAIGDLVLFDGNLRVNILFEDNRWKLDTVIFPDYEMEETE